MLSLDSPEKRGEAMADVQNPKAQKILHSKAFTCASSLARCALARASVTSGGRVRALRRGTGDEGRSSDSRDTMC